VTRAGRDLEDKTGETALSPDIPLRRRVGRRLALVAAASSLVIGVLAFLALAPVERAAVERVAADQVGLLAEAVAAPYTVARRPAPRPPEGAAADASNPEGDGAEENEADKTDGSAHRAAEILEQLKRADGILYIDVTDHQGVTRRSTRIANIGATHPVSRRLRDADVQGDELIVSYGLPFTQACAQCHTAKEDPVGMVRVAVSRDIALKSLQRFHLFYAGAVFLAFAALVLVILVATERLVSRPIFRLARSMKRAEKGDFLVRARVEGEDELGALAISFNQMLRAITTMKATELEREAQLREASAQLTMKKQLEDFAARLSESNAALQRRVQAQELLMEAAHRFGSTLDKGALVDRLARLVNEKLGRTDFAVFLVEEQPEVEGAEHKEVELRAVYAAGALDRDDVRAARFRSGEGLTGLVADTGAPVLIPDLSDPPAHLKNVQRGPIFSEGSLLAVPMLHKGRVVGVLDFYAPTPRAFDADDAAVLQALAAQAAMAVVNADLYQTTLELSVTDALTKLMNRRALNRILDAELVRAQRFGTPLVLLMLDVDHFKQFNDRMGHLLGDEALKAVANALQASIRKVDAVARFGGEEFCVLLPRTDEQHGLDVAEKLLNVIRSLDLLGAESQPLGRMSISIGLAVYPQDMPPAHEGNAMDVLFDSADKAAYEAKRRGRDRVVTHGELSGRPRRPKLNEPTLADKGPKIPS
jgi:diguanylate cyclase (GGDEF)-like protein